MNDISFYADYINIVIIICIAAFFINIPLALRKRRSKIDSLRTTAAKLGLNFTDTADEIRKKSAIWRLVFFFKIFGAEWEINGKYKEFSVKIYPKIYRGGEGDAPTYTFIKVFFKKPVGLCLRIARETFFAKFYKFWNRKKDIQTGDAELDSLCIINGDPASSVIALTLKPDVRKAVFGLMNYNKNIVIEDDGILFYDNRQIVEETEYKAHLEKLTQAARAFAS